MGATPMAATAPVFWLTQRACVGWDVVTLLEKKVTTHIITTDDNAHAHRHCHHPITPPPPAVSTPPSPSVPAPTPPPVENLREK